MTAKMTQLIADAKEIRTQLFLFVEEEFVEMPTVERMKTLNHIFQVMFSFDPGLGVNCP